jgi:hypothetical protein
MSFMGSFGWGLHNQMNQLVKYRKPEKFNKVVEGFLIAAPSDMEYDWGRWWIGSATVTDSSGVLGTVGTVFTVNSTPANSVAFGVSSDISGNIYVVGRYGFSANNTIITTDPIDPFPYLKTNTTILYDGRPSTTTTANTSNNDACFIIKYDQFGSKIWTRWIDGGSRNDQPIGGAIATHSDGTTWIAIRSASNTFNLLSSSIHANIPGNLFNSMKFSITAADYWGLLVNMRPNGTFAWARWIGINTPGAAGTPVTGGTGGVDNAKDVAIDSLKNSYVIGDTETRFPNPSGNTNPISQWEARTGSGQAAYVAKYDLSGAFQWAKWIDGTGADVVNAVTCDSIGNVYIVGKSTSTSLGTFPTDSFPSRAATSTTAGYIVKFNTAGERLWGRWIGGSLTEDISGIAIDSTGSIIYIAGTATPTSSTLTGYPSQFTAPATNILNSGCIFVAKYTSSGECVWGKWMSGSLTGNNITVDSAGNISVVGTTGAVAPDAGVSVDATRKIFIVKFSSDGTILTSKRLTNNNSVTPFYIGKICADRNESIVVAGNSGSLDSYYLWNSKSSTIVNNTTSATTTINISHASVFTAKLIPDYFQIIRDFHTTIYVPSLSYINSTGLPTNVQTIRSYYTLSSGDVTKTSTWDSYNTKSTIPNDVETAAISLVNLVINNYRSTYAFAKDYGGFVLSGDALTAGTATVTVPDMSGAKQILSTYLGYFVTMRSAIVTSITTIQTTYESLKNNAIGILIPNSIQFTTSTDIANVTNNSFSISPTQTAPTKHDQWLGIYNKYVNANELLQMLPEFKALYESARRYVLDSVFSPNTITTRIAFYTGGTYTKDSLAEAYRDIIQQLIDAYYASPADIPATDATTGKNYAQLKTLGNKYLNASTGLWPARLSNNYATLTSFLNLYKANRDTAVSNGFLTNASPNFFNDSIITTDLSGISNKYVVYDVSGAILLGFNTVNEQALWGTTSASGTYSPPTVTPNSVTGISTFQGISQTFTLNNNLNGVMSSSFAAISTDAVVITFPSAMTITRVLFDLESATPPATIQIQGVSDSKTMMLQGSTSSKNIRFSAYIPLSAIRISSPSLSAKIRLLQFFRTYYSSSANTENAANDTVFAKYTLVTNRLFFQNLYLNTRRHLLDSDFALTVPDLRMRVFTGTGSPFTAENLLSASQNIMQTLISKYNQLNPTDQQADTVTASTSLLDLNALNTKYLGTGGKWPIYITSLRTVIRNYINVSNPTGTYKSIRDSIPNSSSNFVTDSDNAVDLTYLDASNALIVVDISGNVMCRSTASNPNGLLGLDGYKQDSHAFDSEFQLLNSVYNKYRNYVNTVASERRQPALTSLSNFRILYNSLFSCIPSNFASTNAPTSAAVQSSALGPSPSSTDEVAINDLVSSSEIAIYTNKYNTQYVELFNILRQNQIDTLTAYQKFYNKYVSFQADLTIRQYSTLATLPKTTTPSIPNDGTTDLNKMTSLPIATIGALPSSQHIRDLSGNCVTYNGLQGRYATLVAFVKTELEKFIVEYDSMYNSLPADVQSQYQYTTPLDASSLLPSNVNAESLYNYMNSYAGFTPDGLYTTSILPPSSSISVGASQAVVNYMKYFYVDTYIPARKYLKSLQITTAMNSAVLLCEKYITTDGILKISPFRLQSGDTFQSIINNSEQQMNAMITALINNYQTTYNDWIDRISSLADTDPVPATLTSDAANPTTSLRESYLLKWSSMIGKIKEYTLALVTYGQRLQQWKDLISSSDISEEEKESLCSLTPILMRPKFNSQIMLLQLVNNK